MSNRMKYLNFSGSIEYDLDDKIFFGKVLDINDLVNFEGDNKEELQQNFQNAINDYIEFCKKINKDLYIIKQ